MSLKSRHQSTTVEIILYYLTNALRQSGLPIYNSRNYSILLNDEKECEVKAKSTTVEIILYYLTNIRKKLISAIYNSRNYSILLNDSI